MKEEWKRLQQNENYAISNFGRVIRLTAGSGTKKGRLMKGTTTDGNVRIEIGHPLTRVPKRYVLSHLVYEHFIGVIPNEHHIHHLDGNIRNNRISNIEPVHTSKHMQAHSSLTLSKVAAIRTLVDIGIPQVEIARELALSKECINAITKNRSWKR